MDLLQTVAIASVAFALLVTLATREDGRAALAYVLGATAGLVAVQLAGVHIFTMVAVLWSLWPPGRVNLQSIKQVVGLAIGATSLAYTSLVGDMVNSPTLALQLLGLAASAGLIALRADPADVVRALRGLLATCTVSSGVGLLQVVGILPTDLWHKQISAIGRPIGIYPEPDWLGLYAALGMLLAWRLKMRALPRLVMFALNTSSFILAFARAAWVAFVAVALLAIVTAMMARRKRRTQDRGRALALVGTAAVGVGTLFVLPSLRTDLTVRIGTLLGEGGGADDISGEARLRQTQALVELGESAPFYGHGLSASGRVSAWGLFDNSTSVENNVASNWLLGFWADGGYLSLPLLAFIIILACRTASILTGQLLILVLINSFFSNAVFFPVTWLLIGLAVYEITHFRRQQINLGPLPQRQSKLAE